ncbi:alkaline shock response membrane anchor protein AmaP [Streptomyces sp. NPDC048442]|uniref:alkaline shock response membrane anchor protein AmaP n=1 Tax=Streptomyces sp. NPDC048442 TaxID=3154823 RepID=UPI0034241BA2
MRNPVNRVLLGVLGLILVGVGGAALTAGLGVGVPSWWPFAGRDDVLLSTADRTRWRDAGWWWPVVVAVLVVCVLLALWWLLAQVRRKRLGVVRIPGDGGAGQVLLRGRALERVLREEAEALEGVARADVSLTGRQDAPRVRIGLLLGPTAAPATAVADIVGVGVSRARDSVRAGSLPAEVRVRGLRRGPRRVD